MASLATLFKGSSNQEQENDKLLHLYRNRVELKKEYAGVRKQQFRLEDRIKQEAGNSARLKQQLTSLEELLLDPKSASNVLVYYQLKGMAVRSHRKLANFGEQLKQQREQRRQNQQLVMWNEQRNTESRNLEKNLDEIRVEIQKANDELQKTKQKLLTMNGILKLIKRRSVSGLLDALNKNITNGCSQELALMEELEAIKTRKPPDKDGLDIATKRLLNFMIISYAQSLFLHFADEDLALMALEANEKGIGAINYGSKKDCAEILARLDNHLSRSGEGIDCPDSIQKRAKLIAENAMFRKESDVVPISGSVTTVFAFDANGDVKETNVDIIGLNYWEIGSIFSR